MHSSFVHRLWQSDLSDISDAYDEKHWYHSNSLILFPRLFWFKYPFKFDTNFSTHWKYGKLVLKLHRTECISFEVHWMKINGYYGKLRASCRWVFLTNGTNTVPGQHGRCSVPMSCIENDKQSKVTTLVRRIVNVVNEWLNLIFLTALLCTSFFKHNRKS